MLRKKSWICADELIRMERESKLKTVDRFDTPEKAAQLQAELEARRSRLEVRRKEGYAQGRGRKGRSVVLAP